VAPDHKRPFIVHSSRSEVVALGTVFEVSEEPAITALTLVEGVVQVTAHTSGSTRSQLLSPGERLSIGANGDITRDRPDLRDVGAWERGIAVFHDSPLQDAISEINRYTHRQIRLVGPIGSMRISGVYRMGDAEAFARDVMLALPITGDFGAEEIILHPRGVRS
jgi:transmembrane sensor